MSCELTASEAATIVKGQLKGRQDVRFLGVGSDTREDLRQKLFVALKGENFDGHNFCQKAVEQGAAAILVDSSYDIPKEVLAKAAVIVVPDSLKGLQDLAHGWRKQLKAQVVGLTGSNGKSTTKDFCYSLMRHFFEVHVSKKSFNNHIGVPLTILEAGKNTQVLLLEMGMNHSGELTELSRIAEPNVVVCTMVGRGHIGNFPEGQMGVVKAKEEIYLANPRAIQIFNCDNEFTLEMFQRAAAELPTERVKAFSSFSAGAEISLRATHMTLDSLQVAGHIAGIKGETKVPVFGRHNVVNLMAAATVAWVLGLLPEVIWKYLPECHSGWGRNQIHKLKNGTTVLFDGYNANPDSVTMLVKNIFEIHLSEGRKIAVLGEMLELGEDTERYHREIGELVGKTDFEIVWFYGSSAAAFRAGIESVGFQKTIIISDTYEDSLAKKVLDMLNPSDVVVIKGSRGSRMERVLKFWDPSFSKS